MPVENGVPTSDAFVSTQKYCSIVKQVRRCPDWEPVEEPAATSVIVDIPIDTIANARNALKHVVVVTTGALAVLDASVAKYGDAEVLRGIGQLLSALAHSVARNWYIFLAVPVLNSHAWYALGKVCGVMRCLG